MKRTEEWPSMLSQIWDKMAFSGYVGGKKHNLHLLCQFIFCNLSEMVNSGLSRTHFNLGFNFFSQKRFARENKRSKFSCSDFNFHPFHLTFRLRTKSGRAWNYCQSLQHFIFPTPSGCEKEKWNHWFHPGHW